MSDTNLFSFENINKSRKQNILKSFSENLFESQSDLNDEISKAIESDVLEKGGKRATLGEIREWNGKKYQKTTQGWIPYKGKSDGSESLKDGDVDVTGQKDTPIPKEDKTLKDKMRDLKNALKTHGEAMHINPKAVSLPHVKKLIENGDVVYSAENNTIKLIHDDKKDTPIKKEDNKSGLDKLYGDIEKKGIEMANAGKGIKEIREYVESEKVEKQATEKIVSGILDHKEKMNESKPKEENIVFSNIKEGDRISYVVPGTTNEMSTGIVNDKNSTSTEDFITVTDEKTKKQIHVFESNWGNLLKDSPKETKEVEKKPRKPRTKKADMLIKEGNVKTQYPDIDFDKLPKEVADDFAEKIQDASSTMDDFMEVVSGTDSLGRKREPRSYDPELTDEQTKALKELDKKDLKGIDQIKEFHKIVGDNYSWDGDRDAINNALSTHKEIKEKYPDASTTKDKDQLRLFKSLNEAKKDHISKSILGY